MRRSRLCWLPLALMLGACQSFGDLLIFGPGLPKASLPPTGGLVPGSVPLAAPTAGRGWRLQAEFVLDGDITWQGASLPDLRLKVVDVGSGHLLADGVSADRDGHFRVVMTDPVRAGTVLLVSAGSGATELLGLVQVTIGGDPADGGPIPIGHATVSLASTLVTKAILPKLAEVILTDSGTPDSQRRLAAVLEQTGQLQGDTRLLLNGIPTDARLLQAIETVLARPAIDTIDALAIAAVQYSHLRGGFAEVVDGANDAVLANLREGGAFIPPSHWQIGYFVIEPPQLRRSGYDTATVTDGGRTATIPVAPGAFALGDERTSVLIVIRQGLHNAPPPPPISGGGGGPATVAAVPAATALIAFISTHLHANGDVFRIGLDGSALTTLTNDAFADQVPVFNRSGSKIAFITDNGGTKLAVMNADGSGRTELAAASSGIPTWSPDGTRIAYVSLRGGNTDIYMLHLPTGVETRLTVDAGIDEQPAWSPDGQRIAFVSYRTGGGDIYAYDLAGGTDSRLTVDPIVEGNPAWSPDSQWLAYNAKSDGNLWKIKADGTGLARVTNSPGRDVKPVWSPDGQWLAFANDRAITDDVYVIKADGTGETAVTTAAGIDNSAVWTADGSTLVFISNRSGQADLYRSAPNGTSQAVILTRPASEGSPSVH